MISNIYTIKDSNYHPEVNGLGQKGLCIVLYKADYDQNKSTLDGLIKAVKMDPSSDAFIVLITEKIQLSQVISPSKISYLISLGVSPIDLGMQTQVKTYFNYKMESFYFLNSDSLSTINADKSKKMALWQNLQALFLN